ncbi:MAG: 50S ribosomal protein L15e [Candidatus Thermoplasmatota archaeon]|nr:50S ribosomal protein L15e [Candidatus Thermoplasmatota archaeon]MCL5983933.1 50S ribosomal protein L15e [Candidatus Thermoplasmatota archaeon]
MASSFRQTLGDEGAALRHERLLSWRRENTVTRVEHPLRLDRARAVGYRAKEGFVVVRVRVRRGGQNKRAIIAGRRPKHKGIARMTLAKSLKRIAEERAQKHYPNLEILNSYWIGEDGKEKFFEVILLDPAHPQIAHDPRLEWITGAMHKGRVYRGLTSTGKEGRGLRWKGKGAERMRPSRAQNRREERRTQTKVIP